MANTEPPRVQAETQRGHHRPGVRKAQALCLHVCPGLLHSAQSQPREDQETRQTQARSRMLLRGGSLRVAVPLGLA